LREKKHRLAIITTHPIQYNAPLFRILSQRNNLHLKVFYTWGKESMEDKFDPGFNKTIFWDIPLLDGYDYEFLENVALNKGSHHYAGIDNPDLIRAICKWQADSILVYGWNFKSHLKAIRYFSGKIPVMFRGDSTLLRKESFWKKSLKILFLRWVYSKIDIAFYAGKNNLAYFLNYGVERSKLIFAPHAIENSRFEIQYMKEVEALKEQLSIKKSEVVYLYAGKLDENKNIQLLINAFLQIANERAHLVIAGNGVAEESLKTLAENKNNIHFLPFQNQSMMPVIYQLCDVFVLPSISETWGLSLNEAMASGKAIIASDGVGAAADLIQDFQNGFVFQNNNVISLQEKLSFLNDKTKVAQFGTKSHEIIQEWNFEKICQSIESTVGVKND